MLWIFWLLMFRYHLIRKFYYIDFIENNKILISDTYSAQPRTETNFKNIHCFSKLKTPFFISSNLHSQNLQCQIHRVDSFAFVSYYVGKVFSDLNDLNLFKAIVN